MAGERVRKERSRSQFTVGVDRKTAGGFPGIALPPEGCRLHIPQGQISTMCSHNLSNPVKEEEDVKWRK